MISFFILTRRLSRMGQLTYFSSSAIVAAMLLCSVCIDDFDIIAMIGFDNLSEDAAPFTPRNLIPAFSLGKWYLSGN